MENIDLLVGVDKVVVLEDLMEKHGRELTNFAYVYVQDWGVAEEVIQDVFLKCYQNLDTFRGDASLKTWIYRITINRCRDEIRKSSVRKLLTSPLSYFYPLKSSELTPEDLLVLESEQERIAHVVLSLPIKYREVIILHYYANLKTEEIGRLIETNAKTVRTRLRRARQLL